MIYSNTDDLEDRVIELLADARSTVKSLHARIGKEMSVSLRGVYKVVTNLVTAGVLLKVGKLVMVDQEWAKRVTEMLSATSAPTLSNQERAVYTFVSVEHLDAFWKTTVLPLEQSLSAMETFFYNPHNFWAYLPARKQSEDAYYRHFSGGEHYGFFTIGGDSTADREFKREYQSGHLQVELMDIRNVRRTDHVTVIGSFIITVRLAERISERIDNLYATGAKIKDILPEITTICQKPGKIRFVLENNSAKAEKLKKILARNFYFRIQQ